MRTVATLHRYDCASTLAAELAQQLLHKMACAAHSVEATQVLVGMPCIMFRRLLLGIGFAW